MAAHGACSFSHLWICRQEGERAHAATTGRHNAVTTAAGASRPSFPRLIQRGRLTLRCQADTSRTKLSLGEREGIDGSLRRRTANEVASQTAETWLAEVILASDRQHRIGERLTRSEALPGCLLATLAL
jgi:hypothetical protein